MYYEIIQLHKLKSRSFIYYESNVNLLYYSLINIILDLAILGFVYVRLALYRHKDILIYYRYKII